MYDDFDINLKLQIIININVTDNIIIIITNVIIIN